MSKELQEIIDIEREDAKEEGRIEGRTEGKAESIKNVMETFGVSMEKAMEALKVPEHEYEKYRKLVLNPAGMA